MGLWGTCYQLGGVAANMWAAFWLARRGTKGPFSRLQPCSSGCGSWCISFSGIAPKMWGYPRWKMPRKS